MHLVDDGVLHGRIRKAGGIPVEVVLDNTRPVGAVCRLLLSPLSLSDDSLGVGVQDDSRLVKAKAPCRVPGAVQVVSILEVLDVEAEDHDGPGLADAVAVRDFDHGVGVRGLSVVEQKLTGRRLERGDREVHTAGELCGSVELTVAGPCLEPADHVCGGPVVHDRTAQVLVHLVDAFLVFRVDRLLPRIGGDELLYHVV